MEIKLSKHYGFCSGVKNAIKIVFSAREKYPSEDIYLLNKLVHNNAVMSSLKEIRVTILDDERSYEEKINSLPNNSIVIYSAHGHDEHLEEIAKKKNLIQIDAICPRVKANMKSIKNVLNNFGNVIYIGLKNHPETIASLAINKNIKFIDFKNPDYEEIKNLKEATVHNQTTLIQTSLENIYNELNKYIPSLHIKNDICFATLNRQNSLNEVTDEDLIIIIGDKISSNSTRLFEVAKNKYPNLNVYQISSLDELKNIDLTHNKKGFITAGASTPENVINPIIEYLKSI